MTERQIVAERLTVGLIPSARDDLAALIEQTGLSKTDLLNRGVQLLAFVQSQLDDGKELLVRHKTSGEVERVHLL